MVANDENDDQPESVSGESEPAKPKPSPIRNEKRWEINFDKGGKDNRQKASYSKRSSGSVPKKKKK